MVGESVRYFRETILFVCLWCMPSILVSFHEVNWSVSSQFKINSWSFAVGYFQYCQYGDFVITDFDSVTKSAGWVGVDRTVCGDGQWWIRITVGMGGYGTKIPSPCTPLVPTYSSYLLRRTNVFSVIWIVAVSKGMWAVKRFSDKML